jgi:Mce-associated membrane protein
MLLVGLVGVAVLLAVGVALLVSGRVPTSDDAEQSALAVARQAAINLLTVDRADPKGSVERLAGESTGRFRQQLDEMADAFAGSLKDAQAGSTGQVSEAGIRAVSAEQASVLVSATANVRNTRVPQGEPVQYRLIVGLERTQAGWLVSSMEFAP